MRSGTEFDAGRYRRDVLDPARKRGNVPPPDLLARYAIAASMGQDPAAFQARLAQLVKYWRGLGQQQRLYRKLADALLAAHAQLDTAGQLSYAHFMQRRQEENDQARAKLKSVVSDIAATTPVVPRATLSWLHDECGGMLSEEAVQGEFAAHGVRVVDEEWVLPRRPSVQYTGLAINLATLSLRLGAEAVFGTEAVRAGFRLRHGFQLASGSRLTRDLLAEQKQVLAQRPHDERRTALTNVLTVLQQATERPGELDALLLWQLIDVLQPQVAAGLPVKSIAAAATGLGLDQAEAAELVLALVQHRSDAGGSRVAALIQEADAAERTGATEEAAELLTAVLATDGDPDGSLRSRLHSLPPPPPGAVSASPKDGVVEVEWRPAPARTPGIRYRLVRQHAAPAAAPGAGRLVAETAGLRASDGEPVSGERLYYTVFATRGGDVWSAGTSAPEVLILPEVADCELVAQADSVLGSWQVGPGAVDVEVTRAAASPPMTGGGEPVPASLAGFHDTAVRCGVRYYYRIRAVYLSGTGERRITPGIVRRATPEAVLGPVPELRAELQAGDDPELLLEWDSVEAGTVRIYRSSAAAPWPPGASVGLDELARGGRPVAGLPASDVDGKRRLLVRPDNGRNYYHAVTVGADKAVLGATVSVPFISPVTALRAARAGSKLRLSWRWPDGCHVCLVQWRPAEAGAEAAPVECSRRRFHDDGGFEITAGPRATTVSVRSLHRDTEGEIVSEPAQATVPGLGVTVLYAFHRKTRWRPWRRNRLVLTADQACRVPPMVVVYRAGRVMPLRPEQGSPVLHLAGADLSPAAPLSVPVPLPAQHGPGWLACFFSEDPPDGMSLVPAESRG
jgi:hypothetical protein